MEAPNWYFEQDIEQVSEYIHINDHILELAEVECEMEELIDELYDEASHVDSDIVHGLILNICEKLNMKKPKRSELKL